MVTVPGVIPVTTPPVPTLATAPLLLLHTPPAVASVSVMLDPAVTDVAPTMSAGVKFIVAVEVAVKPLTLNVSVAMAMVSELSRVAV